MANASSGAITAPPEAPVGDVFIKRGGVPIMITLRTLPMTLRALFSCFLATIGIGYLTAISYLFLVDVEPHRAQGQGMVEGISAKYHGSTSGTRLEAALRGTMADRVNAEERDQVFAWVRDGAKQDDFGRVEEILAKNCAGCHSPQSGMPIPSLATFEDVQKLAQPDTGTSLLALARVSHVHLFGIAIIFLTTGAIFSLSETPVWFRVTMLLVPYAAILADIGSWWATKYYSPVFAWIVIIGGAFMGLSLACQILVSLWDMWVAPRWAPFAARPRPAE